MTDEEVKPETIELKILGSKLFKSKEKFTLDELRKEFPDYASASLCNKLGCMARGGSITKVVGRRGNHRIMYYCQATNEPEKRKPVVKPTTLMGTLLRSAWVTDPTPTTDQPRYY